MAKTAKKSTTRTKRAPSKKAPSASKRTSAKRKARKSPEEKPSKKKTASKAKSKPKGTKRGGSSKEAGPSARQIANAARRLSSGRRAELYEELNGKVPPKGATVTKVAGAIGVELAQRGDLPEDLKAKLASKRNAAKKPADPNRLNRTAVIEELAGKKGGATLQEIADEVLKRWPNRITRSGEVVERNATTMLTYTRYTVERMAEAGKVKVKGKLEEAEKATITAA